MEDSNRSSNPSVHDVSDPSRRLLLQGGAVGAVAALLAKGVSGDPVAAPFHGGFYCPIEFDNSVDNVD